MLSINSVIKNVKDTVKSVLHHEDETLSLLQSVTDLAKEKFSKDKCKPGILVSKITSTTYYVAIHRFLKGGGDEKVVEFGSRSKDLKTSLQEVRSYLEKL